MHQLVAGLSGVEVIADDFVVVGFGDSMEMHQLVQLSGVEVIAGCCSSGVAVQGLSGVEVIADDFVVVGFRDSMEDASVGSQGCLV